MDIENFQNIKLHNMDFREEKMNVENIPLPDEMPKGFNYSNLPKDVLKSSTVENLISQNEDLMARLKVSLRRLALLENENQRLTEDAHRARLSQSAVSDQVLIFKEKDSMWKQKLDDAEKDKEIHIEKARALQLMNQKLQAELSRFRKFHDRIKTQVKPYINQLKEYSRGLEVRAQEAEKNNAQKDAQLSDLRFQITEVTKHSRAQIEHSEKQAQEMIQFYEQQLQNQAQELKDITEINKDLEIRALRLNKALEKQDELENQVVELMRSKEDLKHRLEQEVVRLQDKSNDLHRQNKRLEIEHRDLQDLALSNETSIKALEQEKTDLGTQLDSLRYMWNAKNEENEKLKSALNSLEKLNVELSQKVNELRTQGATT